MRRGVVIFVVGLSLFATFALTGLAQENQKLTLQQVIERHVAAVGTSEARQMHRACGLQGTAKFRIAMGGTGQAEGPFKLASDGQKLRMVMRFNTGNYMGEDFVTDGAKVQVANLVSGKPTLLGQFFADRASLLKEGLFGGAIGGDWVLFDPKATELKLSYNGLKNVDGRPLHELVYEPKKNVGEIRIRLYLEPETYRHVLTMYDAKMFSQGGTTAMGRGRSAPDMTRQESRISLKEQFDDFQQVDGVTMPKKWTMELTNDSKGGSRLEWIVTVEDVMHGEIDAASFKMR